MANWLVPQQRADVQRVKPTGIPMRVGFVDKLLGRKDWQTSGLPGANAGWTGGGLNQLWQRGGLPRRLSNYLATYGGTEESAIWVYACVSLIMAEGASYPYEIVTKDGEQLEESDIPEDLRALLKRPNPDMTYFDFSEAAYMDLELAGNSYWLKDEVNPLGQPKWLWRLRPDLMQVAVDSQDRVIGYVYNIQNVQIPYDLDQLVRFRYPHPVDTKYGMGTVEAIQRAIGANLAEDEHVAGFFQGGAKLSGILTVSENISDVTFERLKAQFAAEFGHGGSNQFGVLVAEQGQSYEPLSVAPQSSGVIELKGMTKDEILSGFGIPGFLLGGVAQGGIYKMSEAQHIFSRAMYPKAMRFGEKMTSDLVRYWDDLEFRVDVTVTEPMEDKLIAAGEMLGRGASLNQVLDRMDLPPLEDDAADRPLLNGGMVFLDQMAELADQAVESGQQAIDQANQPQDQFGGGGFDQQNNAFDQQFSDQAAQDSTGDWADLNQYSGHLQSADNLDAALIGRTQQRGIDFITALRPGQKPRRKERVRQIKSSDAEFALPAGYERITEIRTHTADADLAHELIKRRASAFREHTDDIRGTFVQFFIEQRKRVEKNLPSRHKTAASWYPKKDINIEKLWDEDAENAFLKALYEAMQVQLGATAFKDVGAALGTDLQWDLQNPHIGQYLDDTGRLIKRINDTTRDAIRDQIRLGLDRSYGIPQIANGVPDEGYKGIAGVFDEATAARAETIARSETAMLYNRAAVAGYATAGIGEVEVIDGIEYDAGCKEANGQTWTLDHAAEHPIEHPNCVRSFIPLVASAGKGVKTERKPYAERLHPRGPGGRFRGKPGVDVPDVHVPNLGKPGSGSRRSDLNPALSHTNPRLGDHTSNTTLGNPLDDGDWIDVGGDLEKAALLISQGKKVRLQQADQVSTLVDKLAAMVDDAKAKGEKAPTYDLCNVSVPGTNLFCLDKVIDPDTGKPIPRIKMPQLKGEPLTGTPADKLPRDKRGEVDILPQFREALSNLGVKNSDEVVPVSHLRASQSELDGAKVAGIARFLRSGGHIDGQIIISKDGYVVDGHHRWAAEVANDAADGHLGDLTISAVKVDLSITEVLALARLFAKKNGIPQADVSAGRDKTSKSIEEVKAWLATLSDEEREEVLGL